MSAIVVRPLTPARWPDLEALFAAKGCSVARHCWCMAYRKSGAMAAGTAPANRAALKALVDSGRPPGLVGYRGRTPVGWVSIGPREDYARLARSPIMKPVDDVPVWSIVCFVVPPEQRGQGVARALLDAAVAYASSQGVHHVEGYPVEPDGRVRDENLWFGTTSMFAAAGFDEIARRKPTRPVMRIATAAR